MNDARRLSTKSEAWKTRNRKEFRIRDHWNWFLGPRRKPPSLETGIELQKISEKVEETVPLRDPDTFPDVSGQSKPVSRKKVKKKKKIRTELSSNDDDDEAESKPRQKNKVLKSDADVKPDSKFSGETKLRVKNSGKRDTEGDPRTSDPLNPSTDQKVSASSVDALWICSASLISIEGGRGEVKNVRNSNKTDESEAELDLEVENYLSEVEKRLSEPRKKVSLIVLKQFLAGPRER